MNSNWHPRMGDHKVTTDVHHQKRKKFEKRARLFSRFFWIAAAVISLLLILITLGAVSG